jgi:hypothetical protein
LPGAELVSVQLQDMNYDRRLLHFGPLPPTPLLKRAFAYVYWGLRRRLRLSITPIERWLRRPVAIDQTRRPDTFAQIQTIVRRRPLDSIQAPG